MTTKIAALLAVTLLPACGAAARSTALPSETPRAVGVKATSADLSAPADQRNTADDYVVGPFVAGDAGVRTYYIVRN